MNRDFVVRSLLRAAFAALAVVAMSSAGQAQVPNVTFTMDLPDEFVPNTSYTLQLNYAVTGQDLRNVVIDIDFPTNVVVFGKGAVDSFTQHCTYQNNNRADWRCHFDAGLLPVPSGGLSGQIPITVRVPPNTVPDGASFSLSATMNGQYGDEDNLTDLTEKVASGSVPLATVTNTLGLSYSYHDPQEIGYATHNGVPGAVMILYATTVNSGLGYVHPGAEFTVEVPAGTRIVRSPAQASSRMTSTTYDTAWEEISELQYDVTTTIRAASVNTQSQGSEGHLANSISLSNPYTRTHVWLPCASMPLADDLVLQATLVGSTQADGGNVSTLIQGDVVINSFLRGATTACLRGATLGNSGSTTLGPGQQTTISFRWQAPGGVNAGHDAFISVALPDVIKLNYVWDNIGWLRGGEGHGFTKYRCAIPEVDGELTRAAWETYRADRCTTVGDFNQNVFDNTTHLVNYADTWEIDESGTSVTYGDMDFYLYVAAEGCSGIGDMFTWHAHTSVRPTVAGTPVVLTDTHTITITGDASIQTWNFAKKTTANLGSLETYTYGVYPNPSSAPAINMWTTIDLPPGVVPISVVPRDNGACLAEYVEHEFLTKLDGTQQIRIFTGDETTSVYSTTNCQNPGCTPASYPIWEVTVFYDPSHPFVQGQTVSLLHSANADNYPGTDRTHTHNVTMQVPAEKRLTVEPLCDGEGSLGLKGTISNSGGVPLSGLELVMPVAKVGDGSGTEVNTFYFYDTFDEGPGISLECLEGTSVVSCSASTTAIRLSVADLPAYASVSATMFLNVAPTAEEGDIVRGTADLSSNELLPISTRESAPAKVDLCPGELDVSAWFDADSSADRQDGEISLVGWKVLVQDAARPELEFEFTIPASGVITTNLAQGDYNLTVENPNTGTEGTFGFTTMIPDSFTITTGNTTEILIGANCSCNDDDVCTADVCSVAGTCSYSLEELPDIPDDNCDGVDNNCNRETDEDYAPVATSCGLGNCASTGMSTCVNGTEGTTCVEGTESPEVCGGGDEDCDGLVDAQDNTMLQVNCEKTLGVCNGTKKRRDLCVNGAWQACIGSDYAANAFPLVYSPDNDSCDGFDNDCNGTNDNGFVSQDTDCGQGACASTGQTRCLNGAVSDTCTEGEPSTETCDGDDNDCDGLVDAEDVSMTLVACEKGEVGVCQGARKPASRCVNGSWTACTDADYAAHAPGVYSPTDATCDGVDNDCGDGADDDFQAESTRCGVGECAGNTGMSTCSSGNVGDTCNPLAGASEGELCNALDDNCNGSTDEGLGLGQGCDGDDADQCANGVVVCDPNNASTTTCEETSTDVVEICDGVDNDCDGDTDEGCDDDVDGWCDSSIACVDGACENGCGDCNDENGDVNPGADEVCDDIDNNCNDQTDEGCDDDGDDHCEAAIGCAGEGLPSTCQSGCGDCVDTDEDIYPGASETCNGLDDNCNQQTDEGFTVGDECEVGRGECVNTGSNICNGGGDGVVCDAQPHEGVAELCDGLDNDCDGVPDEDFNLGEECQVGVGACLSGVGARVCRVDKTAGCSAQAGTPSQDSCDGVDNDCDGFIDNVVNSPQTSICPDIDTRIDSRPQSVTSSQIADFTYVDPLNATTNQFECQLDGGSWVPCDGRAITYSSLSVGAHTFLVRSIGADGDRDETPAFYSWLIDTSVPDTIIDSAPSNPSQSPSAVFEFSATVDDPSGYWCALDPVGDNGTAPAPGDAVYSPCDPRTEFMGLSEGSHTLYVYVVNQAGTPDPTPADHTWVIDLTAPETVITAGPALMTSEGSASFDYEDPADATTDTFLCSLDGGDWTECDDGSTTYDGLSEGEHVFEVAAVDATGNVDPTPATWRWTVDDTPPDTMIPIAPTDPSQSGNAVFAFGSDETPVTYYCVLDPTSVPPDAEEYELCASTATYTDLADGTHRIWVYAVDTAGNADPTPANYKWLIDTTFPETAYTSKPASLVSPTDDNLFDYEDPDVPEHVDFDCSLDGDFFAPCDGGTITLGPLPIGPHEMQVRACQRALNQCDPTPAIYVWEVTSSPCPLDMSSPTIMCGDAVTFECTDGMANVDVASLAPAANDSCEPINVTWNAPEVFGYGNTPIVFQATDGNANLSTCITQVTVTDSQAPTIVCPDAVTVSTPVDACGVAVAMEPTSVTDGCFPDNVLRFNNAPQVFGVGETTVTFTALDPAGNEASCTTTVTVVDDVPLTLTCEETLTQDAPEDACGWDGTLTATATDNCAIDIAVVDETNQYSVGTHTVTFDAADESGNEATCVTTLTVIDVTDPTALCGELTGAVPAVILATGDDACGVTLSISGLACSRDVDGTTTEIAAEDCPATVSGAQIAIDERLSEGDLLLAYTVTAVDPSGNETVVECDMVFNPDADGDGVIDSDDNCISVPNKTQVDGDEDGVGDACDVCAAVADADQADTDEDGVGDACDLCVDTTDAAQGDADEDGVGDACDICPAVADADQTDVDENGVGDLCQDTDEDGVLDAETSVGPADNCVDIVNAEQLDWDEDGIGNACDAEDTSLAAAGSGGCASSGGAPSGFWMLLMFALVAAWTRRRRMGLPHIV